MARLERDEIAELKECLAKWKTPIAMHTAVDIVMDSIGNQTLFTQAGLEFLRDASICAEFGMAREAAKVRLISADRPDFELCVNDEIEAFEAVEADNPRRRRGDEYRYKAHKVGHSGIEDWISESEQAYHWLRRSCEKKKRKGYSENTNLIIYLNLNDFGIRYREVEDCFSAATEIVKDEFSSVWVLWKLKAYLVWCQSAKHTRRSVQTVGLSGHA